MKKTLAILTLLVACLVVPHKAEAQVTTANHLQWSQSAQDLTTAQALTFKYYPDGTTTGSPLDGGVTCTGTTSPFTCTVLIPPFTPQAHTISVTATNIAGESLKSNTISFTFVVVPSAPSNLQIVKLERKPYSGRLNLV